MSAFGCRLARSAGRRVLAGALSLAVAGAAVGVAWRGRLSPNS